MLGVKGNGGAEKRGERKHCGKRNGREEDAKLQACCRSTLMQEEGVHQAIKPISEQVTPPGHSRQCAANRGEWLPKIVLDSRRTCTWKRTRPAGRDMQKRAKEMRGGREENRAGIRMRAGERE